MERRRKLTIRPADKYIQVGYVVIIKKKPVDVRKNSLFLNTEHIIITPPEGKLNIQAGVYIKG